MTAEIMITGRIIPTYTAILSQPAVQFVAALEMAFGNRRRQLLQARQERQTALDAGRLPRFLPETAPIRQANWQVSPPPAGLQQRWVEITGPTERKMMINALNSGADVFMADFEDANAPTWDNMLEGQLNLGQAVDKSLAFISPDGKSYRLNEQVATLMVRPRGWHLEEGNLLVNGRPVSASLFDFGLFFFHNAHKLVAQGYGPYFYLPKLENHLEARLWNDVFIFAQERLGLPKGTIRATVLIETILAAFEMEEILYCLRDHSAGLNAGRWDYIFSIIKKFKSRPGFILPDRAQITMTTPFMAAYSQLLVNSCHKRGAQAIGGMAAYIPRKEAEANRLAFEKVTADKVREAQQGFDGTWVAHPGLVSIARQVFGQPHPAGTSPQSITAENLLQFEVPAGTISEAGLRYNLNVAVCYLESWLGGAGAVALYDLMEDTATAEISRAQVWQWIHHPTAALPDGRKITVELAEQLLAEELARIEAVVGPELFGSGRYTAAADFLRHLLTAPTFPEFLTNYQNNS